MEGLLALSSRTLVFLLTLLLQGPAFALELKIIEVSEPEYGDVMQRITVENILATDPQGKPTLNLFPRTDTRDDRVVRLLLPGISVDLPEIRHRIGSALATLPQQCLTAPAYAHITVAPIATVNKWVPGITDNRRIYRMSLYCLESLPAECSTCLCDNAGFDFGLGSLLTLVKECNQAVLRDMAAGVKVKTPPSRKPDLAKPSIPAAQMITLDAHGRDPVVRGWMDRLWQGVSVTEKSTICEKWGERLQAQIRPEASSTLELNEGQFEAVVMRRACAWKGSRDAEDTDFSKGTVCTDFQHWNPPVTACR